MLEWFKSQLLFNPLPFSPKKWEKQNNEPKPNQSTYLKGFVEVRKIDLTEESVQTPGMVKPPKRVVVASVSSRTCVC